MGPTAFLFGYWQVSDNETEFPQIYLNLEVENHSTSCMEDKKTQ